LFRSVLIANRGEIAARIIRACHEVGARAIAVYSTADAASPHLELADETICIGPGPAASSYLNQDAILQAALQTDAQAIHPGFGFLSENARFASRCAQQKLTFVGPSPSVIRSMGDKATARRTMRAAGLPVLPGSEALVDSPEAARLMAEEVGYPVLLKATAGGGGRGMRRVDRAEDLEGAFLDAAREAEAAFGNGALYLEKFIVGGRHIEIQVLADSRGKVIHLGERDCSIQRNNQKLIEESPAPGFTEERRQRVGAMVCDAVAAIGYTGAGTVEFLMDASGDLYFMEMNTRIQVEHPVSELVTGIDLVAWQLRVAAGQALTVSQTDVTLRGHAIECRVNAEDAAQGFRPAPGTITRLVLPPNASCGPVRIDTHVREGYRIPPFYDSMIGKVIVHGATRREAIERMVAALNDVVIEGVPTTIAMHKAILRHPRFVDGDVTCRFLLDHPELMEGE